MRAVERVDEAAVRQRRPPARLHGAADLQRELVEAPLPLADLDARLAGEAPEVAVRAHVVEAVIVHADVREMRRHPLDGARATQLEKARVAGRIELQQRGAELEALRPLGPSP